MQLEETKVEDHDDDALDLDKVPTRDEAIDYALTIVGTQDRELMTQALINCFGRYEVITYQNLEQTKTALTEIYDKLEIDKVTKQFEGSLTVSDGGTQTISNT